MTGLIPWRKKTKNSLAPLNRELDSICEDFFKEPFLPLTGMFSDSDKLRPSIDITEKKDAIIVAAEIPGMEKDEIDVSLTGRFLTMKGEKSVDYTKDKKNFFHRERSYGYFERSVKLPADVDEASVKAKYKRGVLTVSMKKKENNRRKLIEVRTDKKD